MTLVHAIKTIWCFHFEKYIDRLVTNNFVFCTYCLKLNTDLIKKILCALACVHVHHRMCNEMIGVEHGCH